MISTRVKPADLRTVITLPGKPLIVHFACYTPAGAEWGVPSRFYPRLASIGLAVFLVATVTNWLLGFSASRTPAEPVRTLPADQTDIQAGSVDAGAVARLFGAPPDAATNIRALGVMAEGSTGRGIALIGVEGKPPRPVRAGEAIAPGVILSEVRRDGVVVSRAGAQQQIRLATKPPSQGVLPER